VECGARARDRRVDSSLTFVRAEGIVKFDEDWLL